jgi:quinol monooxygenase YgiN
MSIKRWSLMLAAAAPLVLGAPAPLLADEQQYVVVYVEFLPAVQKIGAQLLQRLADLGAASPGAISFTANQQIDRENFYVLVEIWKNSAAYTNFKNSANAQALIQKIQRYLEAPFDERDGTLIE